LVQAACNALIEEIDSARLKVAVVRVALELDVCWKPTMRGWGVRSPLRPSRPAADRTTPRRSI
jgi:hypothetical protein